MEVALHISGWTYKSETAPTPRAPQSSANNCARETKEAFWKPEGKFLADKDIYCYATYTTYIIGARYAKETFWKPVFILHCICNLEIYQWVSQSWTLWVRKIYRRSPWTFWWYKIWSWILVAIQFVIFFWRNFLQFCCLYPRVHSFAHRLFHSSGSDAFWNVNHRSWGYLTLENSWIRGFLIHQKFQTSNTLSGEQMAIEQSFSPIHNDKVSLSTLKHCTLYIK